MEKKQKQLLDHQNGKLSNVHLKLTIFLNQMISATVAQQIFELSLALRDCSLVSSLYIIKAN